ncbi:uncharacterized protein LOC132577641 [Heteronotia binoei]|uniref:uncharacterized protein LOC132577641 n=1 Tax=Heteronotia binoei TaxID=13085 RepID=UPI0029311711|nr:uncharacterized protein LOC132577641 [Heteronotia binoei]
MPPQKSGDLKNRKSAVGGKASKASKGDLKNRKSSLGAKASKDVGKIPPEQSPKGKSSSDKFKLFLLNHWAQLVAFLIFLSLLLLFLWYLRLYTVELKKLSEKYRAVTRIHEFMKNYNESFEEVNETEAMKGVGLILNEVSDLRATNAEVQAAIDGVIQMMTNGWVSFKSHLYFFDIRLNTYDFATKACKAENAIPVTILTGEEEPSSGPLPPAKPHLLPNLLRAASCKGWPGMRDLGASLEGSTAQCL